MDLKSADVELDHVAIVVRDMDNMVAFYRDVIGLDVVRSGTVPSEAIERLSGAPGTKARFAFLGARGSAKIELGEFVPAGEESGRIEAFDTPGIRHVAFNVTSISEVAERMRSSPHTGDLRVEEVVIAATGALLKRGILRDPEANSIELIERPRPRTDPDRPV